MPRLGLLLPLVAAAAFAHDLWMVEEKGRVLVRIGEDFPVATNGLTAERIVFLRVAEASRVSMLEGAAGEKQYAAPLPGAVSGPLLVELEVKPRFITLKAPDFNRYIQGERFSEVIAARKAGGATDSPGREIYSRYSKLLVEAPGDDGHLSVVRGHRLEIVPERNPARLPSGEPVPLRVLFDGKPLAGVLVSAGPAGMKGHQFPARATTDAEGRVGLAISSGGLWYARLIHMIPSREPEAEWRSFFATLVFRRR